MVLINEVLIKNLVSMRLFVDTMRWYVLLLGFLLFELCQVEDVAAAKGNSDDDSLGHFESVDPFCSVCLSVDCLLD